MKRICIPITTRGNYAKLKSVIDLISDCNDLEYVIIIGGEAVIPKYGLIDIIAEREVRYLIEGETPLTMTKSAGLAMIEFANAFSDIKPDMVVVVGDRYDTLAITMAAVYMNIPVAHIEGGETSGSIDESIRHAITKLSHLHFPATNAAAQKIWDMGENADDIHMVGATSLDVIDTIDLYGLPRIENTGVGGKVDLKADYIVVLYHPVTTEYGECYKQTTVLLDEVLRSGFQAVWIWPHGDAGGDGISKAIRVFRELLGRDYPIRWVKGLSIEDYLPLIYNSICLVGNSSSGIREASYLGVPVVNIGTRQHGRQRCPNVVDVGCNEREISDGIFKQFEHGRFDSDTLYGSGDAGEEIVKVLREWKGGVQK